MKELKVVVNLKERKSPPVWWSGLKDQIYIVPFQIRMSPPVWWSGLKVFWVLDSEYLHQVSTCVVEWIESLSAYCAV